MAHGFRSVAIESDRVAATDVDAYVQGGDASLDAVLASGFSHGLERLDATRELVTWLRAYNEGRPPAQRVAVHGFDAPLEMTFAPSPGPYLRHAHAYLARHLPSTRHAHTDLDVLLGDDGRWSDPAALRDATRSVGASPEAVALRAVTDDLLTTLYAEAPALVGASSPDEWQRAQVHAATALGLLRYHAQAAEDAPRPYAPPGCSGSATRSWHRTCSTSAPGRRTADRPWSSRTTGTSSGTRAPGAWPAWTCAGGAPGRSCRPCSASGTRSSSAVSGRAEP